MMYLHYEDAHEQAFDRGDDDAKGIIERVNSFMISDVMRYSAVRPSSPFNMRYFYHSLIGVIGRFLGKPLRSGLDELDKVSAVYIPDLASPEWREYDFVTCGLAEAYIDEVRRCSVVSDSNFDVAFACFVASKSIDSKWLSVIANQERSTEDNQDFDKWLARFNK